MFGLFSNCITKQQKKKTMIKVYEDENSESFPHHIIHYMIIGTLFFFCGFFFIFHFWVPSWNQLTITDANQKDEDNNQYVCVCVCMTYNNIVTFGSWNFLVYSIVILSLFLSSELKFFFYIFFENKINQSKWNWFNLNLNQKDKKKMNEIKFIQLENGWQNIMFISILIYY